MNKQFFNTLFSAINYKVFGKKYLKIVLIAVFVTSFSSPVHDNLIKDIFTFSSVQTAYAEYDDFDNNQLYTYSTVISTVPAFSVSTPNADGTSVAFTKPSASILLNGSYFSSLQVFCTHTSGNVFSVGNTTVTCSAYNYYTGETVYSSFVVTVVYAPLAPTVSISPFSPSRIEVGQSSTISFTSTDATSCTASGFWTTPIGATGGSFNTGAINTIGNYTQSVTCTGPGGQTTSGTSFLSVVDTTAPVISLLGNSSITVAVGTSYTDSGAVAFDNYEGNITSRIVTTGSVNTAVIGTYTISYDVKDNSGNTATTVTRTINVSDASAPIITLTGVNPQIIQVGTAYTELGATVTDNYDVGLVATINSSTVNTSATGTYLVTYNTNDTHGNIATQVTRTVNVVDTRITALAAIGGIISSPGITTVTYGGSQTYTITPSFGYAIASVTVDGVNQGAIGSYTFTNVTAPHTISATFVATTFFIIAFPTTNGSISPAATTTVISGGSQTYTISPFAGYTITSVTVDGVNQGAIGSYTFTNVTASHTISATFADLTAPLITILGNNPATTTVGFPYIDDGATAFDTVDGTTTVTVTDNVNTAATGTYTVVYTSTDLSGNVATSTRMVTVVDQADLSLLIAAKIIASGLIVASSTESTIPGDHIIGSLALLVAANTAANATTSSPQAVVDSQVIALNAAITTYNASLVALSDVTALDAALATSTILISASSTESTTPGDHIIGSLATLIASSTSVTATSTSAQSVVDAQTAMVIIANNNYITSIVGASNMTALNNAKANAVGIILLAAPESTTPGDHIIGSLATLIAAHSAANATAASSQVTIDAQVIILNAAIATYNASIVPASDLSLLIAAKITAAGLIVASSTESTTPGDHIVGSRIILIAAQAAADATATSSQIVVDAQVTTLNTAIATYNTSIVSLSDMTAFNAAKATTAAHITASSTESTTPGDHIIGSLATLITANVAANATASNTQAFVDAQTAVLIAANNTYTSAIVPLSDVTALNTAKAIAVGLIIASAPESTTPGDHIIGSLAILITENNNANATDSSSQTTIDAQVITLLAAIATYNAAIVPFTTYFDIFATSGADGTITPSGTTTVVSGANQTYTFATTTAGYDIATVIVDGVSVATSTSYTFTNVTAPHSILVTFAAIGTPVTTFDISITSSGPGSMTPTGVITTTQGTDQTILITPNGGSSLISLVIDGIVATTTTSHTFTNIQANHTVDAVFAPTGVLTNTIIATAGANGTISPLGNIDVISGASQTYTFATTTAGYDIATVIVDGVSVATSTSYTFANVTAPHSIQVTFADFGAPVITILGNNPETVTVGGVYVDAGATAFDLVDGTTTVATSTDLNVNATGTYSYVYTSSDAAGNVATSTRIINVIDVVADTTAPVITITGSSTVTITIGNSYMEFGAIVTDNVDAPKMATIAGVVNTSATGTYTITYSATDIAGNIATPVTRTITVIDAVPTPDTTAPVITLNGGASVQVLVGGSYTELGATALDAVDGVVSVITTGSVDTNATGTYIVTYTATDAALNGTSSIRTVSVVDVLTQDTLAPVITVTGSSTVNIIIGNSYTELGAIALDDVDGSFAATVTGSVDTNATGTYTITYNASDIAGNVATPATRTINVIDIPTPDTVAPIITITGSTSTSITIGSTYTELGAVALDAVDGSFAATVTGSVNTNVTGTYFITYSATDAAGNAATPVMRVVTVTPDITVPVITLTGGVNIQVLVGTSYTELGATAVDAVDGSVSVVITGSVNANATGTYIITYTATDAALNSASTTRTINVVDVLTPDTVPPVITVTGSSTMNILVGTSYTELGATAVDAVDGSVSVVITGSVNANATGTYIITYTATDAALNSASTTRTIHVLTTLAPDTTSPIITVTGSSTIGIALGGTYTELGAVALDNIDGSFAATATGTVDTNTLGTYTITYSATDIAGNVATPVTRTVYVFTNTGSVDIINSTINSTYYASSTLSAAVANILNIFGTALILNSTLTNVTTSSSSLTNVTASDTVFDNADLTNCTVINSYVKNYFGSGCYISDSVVDPVGVSNNISGSVVMNFSKIYVSDFVNSTSSHSYIATSTIFGSTLINSTSTLSNISSSTFSSSTISSSTIVAAHATSTIIINSVVTNTSLLNSTSTDSTIVNGTVTGSTISAGSNVATSTIENSTVTLSHVTDSTIASSTVDSSTVSTSTILFTTVTNSTIANASTSNTTISSSTLENASISNGVINNNVITSGTVFPNGTTTPIIITVPTPLADIINFTPSANATATINYLAVTFVDSSTDLNASSTLGDSWTYFWNFGDSTSLTSTTTTLGNSPSHTYTNNGTYTVILTITDKAGNVSTKTFTITVAGQVVSGGGGGSSYGGSYGIISPIATSTMFTITPNTYPVGMIAGVASTTITKHFFTRNLTIGSRGTDVTTLQNILKFYGFYTFSTSTGYFGPITKEAVIKFQKAYNLTPYPGSTGPKTRLMLNRLQGLTIENTITTPNVVVTPITITKNTPVITVQNIVKKVKQVITATTTPKEPTKTWSNIIKYLKSSYINLTEIVPTAK